MASERSFVSQGFYHVYNRGVAKQLIFHDEADYRQFLRCLSFYREESPTDSFSLAKKNVNELEELLAKEPTSALIVLHAYCLMPNHFHLLIEQKIEGGVSTYMRRVQLSYTRYYNTRYGRVGPLFQGVFKAVTITSDQQLLHVSRYIHFNPFVAKLSVDPLSYQWSSLSDYYEGRNSRLCQSEFLLTMTGSRDEYRRFVEDYASYAQDLHSLKDSLIDV